MSLSKTSKKVVMEMFKSYMMPHLRQLELDSATGRIDIDRRNEAWNDWVDSFCKAGHITEKQSETWTKPAFLKKR